VDVKWPWAAAVALVTAVAVAGVWRVTVARNPCRAADAVKAPMDFTLKDMDGRDVSLASFKGRPVLINFWATWCGPCKEEIPALVQLADKYKSQHLAILGISTDDRADELKKFAAEYKMNYPVLVGLGQDDLLDAYDAQVAVPMTWFIRPCGVIAAKHPGVATQQYFEEQIQALF
jgi:thiol-disulfide isomerase/thioredoxin